MSRGQQSTSTGFIGEGARYQGASSRLLGRGTGVVGHGLAVFKPLTALLAHVAGALLLQLARNL